MPIPSEWDDRVLQRTFEDDRGNPMTGTVTVTPTVPYVEADDEATAWFSRPVTAELDEDGTVTITVRVADPDMRQSEYTHQIVEELTYPDIPGQQTPAPIRNVFNILIEPGSDPLLYGALAPVPAGQGIVIVPGLEGPQGDPGPAGATGPAGAAGAAGASAYATAVAGGFMGTEAEWLLSLKGDPGDTSGLHVVATTGDFADLENVPGGGDIMVGTERQTQAILPAKTLVACDYNDGTSTWDATPASHLRVVFFSDAAHDPGAEAKEGDVWFVTP